MGFVELYFAILPLFSALIILKLFKTVHFRKQMKFYPLLFSSNTIRNTTCGEIISEAFSSRGSSELSRFEIAEDFRKDLCQEKENRFWRDYSRNKYIDVRDVSLLSLTLLGNNPRSL